MLPRIHSTSLHLRDLLRDQHCAYQDLDSVLLPTPVSEEIIPSSMLDSNGLLCSNLHCFHLHDRFPVSPNLLHLEQKSKRQMRESQLCILGQCCHQHSTRYSYHALTSFRTPDVAAKPKEEDRAICNVWSGRPVSIFCGFRVLVSSANFNYHLGGSVCILSIIRLWSLRTFGLTADPTWDNVPTTFWSILETTVAILCACVPAIRAGFAQAFSRAWESSVNHSTIFSQKISVGRVGNSMAAGPSGQSWPAQELGSKSTLDILDEEADPPGTSKLSLSCLPDPRRELAFDSGLNLMKPLPLPVSRPTYISSLKK